VKSINFLVSFFGYGYEILIVCFMNLVLMESRGRWGRAHLQFWKCRLSAFVNEIFFRSSSYRWEDVALIIELQLILGKLGFRGLQCLALVSFQTVSITVEQCVSYLVPHHIFEEFQYTPPIRITRYKFYHICSRKKFPIHLSALPYIHQSIYHHSWIAA